MVTTGYGVRGGDDRLSASTTARSRRARSTWDEGQDRPAPRATFVESRPGGVAWSALGRRSRNTWWPAWVEALRDRGSRGPYAHACQPHNIERSAPEVALVNSPAIVVEDLRKSFRDVVALDGVDFQVPEGTVFGLLGPNGAGKTTAVRVLATVLRPDGGRALVLGHDVVGDPNAVRRRIRLAGQNAAVDPNLTGRENLRLMGLLGQLPGRSIMPRAAELLERFGLSNAAVAPFGPTREGCAGACC